MFLDGYIGAPPTIAVVSLAAGGTNPTRVALTAKAATPARRITEMRFMVRSVLITVGSSHGEDVDRYGATRVTDAWRCSQVRELAAANDRTRRLAGGRTARGLERDGKNGVAPGLIGKSWRNGYLGEAVGGQNTKR